MVDVILSDGGDNYLLTTAEGPFYINGGGGYDTLTVDRTGQQSVQGYWSAKTGLGRLFNSDVDVQFANFERVILKGGDEGDAFSVIGNVSAYFDGGDGQDRLSIDVSDTDKDIRFMLDNQIGAESSFEGVDVVVKNVEDFSLKTGSGNDDITLGSGNDILYVGRGKNVVNLGSGDDYVMSEGIDNINGGFGLDSWYGDYSSSIEDVSVWYNLDFTIEISNGSSAVGIENSSLVTGSGNDGFHLGFLGHNVLQQIDAGSGYDRLFVDWSRASSMQIVSWTGDARGGQIRLEGSYASDRIKGDGIDEIDVRLGQGDDSVLVGRGAFHVDGGNGFDTLDIDIVGYTGDVDFTFLNQSGVINYLGAFGSKFVNFEKIRVLSGSGNDHLVGGTGDDEFDAGEGNDTVEGGMGDDRLSGGNGIDWLSYEKAGAGVTAAVSQLSLTVNTQTAGTDWIYGFENIRGSRFADILTGDSYANVIDGFGGGDTMRGS